MVRKRAIALKAFSLRSDCEAGRGNINITDRLVGRCTGRTRSSLGTKICGGISYTLLYHISGGSWAFTGRSSKGAGISQMPVFFDIIRGAIKHKYAYKSLLYRTYIVS